MSYQIMMGINREELDQIYLTIDSNIVWQAQKLSTEELKGKHTLATNPKYIHYYLPTAHPILSWKKLWKKHFWSLYSSHILFKKLKVELWAINL